MNRIAVGVLVFCGAMFALLCVKGCRIEPSPEESRGRFRVSLDYSTLALSIRTVEDTKTGAKYVAFGGDRGIFVVKEGEK